MHHPSQKIRLIEYLPYSLPCKSKEPVRFSMHPNENSQTGKKLITNLHFLKKNNSKVFRSET